MEKNYYFSTFFNVIGCLSIIFVLSQPSIGNALTLTKAEKKEYQKDQARAEQKNIFQYDWSEVAGDDSWGSFKSPHFHSELISGKNFSPIGVASNAFDGVYKYDYQCNGDKIGSSSPWDGSKFFIKNGTIGNDRGGAGRIKMEFGTVDGQGRFLMKFYRLSPGGKKYTGRDYLFTGQLWI